MLSHFHYIIVISTTEAFFCYCVPGSTLQSRMDEDLPMDYTTIFTRNDSKNYAAKNVMISEALAKNMTQVFMPCALCNHPIFCEIAGAQLAEIVQGRCSNRG